MPFLHLCMSWGGDDAIYFWQEQGNFDMLLITEDREIYVTLRMISLWLIHTKIWKSMW